MNSTPAPARITVYPRITLNPLPIPTVESQPFSGQVATFTDPAGLAGDYVATIDWNDGSPTTNGAITKEPDGKFTVTGSHTYNDEGPYAPTVTVTDDDVPYNTDTVVDSGPVGDAPLSPATPGSLTGVEGTSLAGVVGIFTDANPLATTADYTATVAWGDGTSSGAIVTPNPDGTFSVNGSHTYTEEGTYQTIASVTDDGGSTTTVNGQVNVADATLSGAGVPAAGTSTLSNFTVATFSDHSPDGYLRDFTATIDWGDGTTSPGVIAGPAGPSDGPYTVRGSHTYATLGPKTITVHIVDDGGQTLDLTDHDVIYAPSNFVVGDLSIGAFSQGAVNNGANVNFWGSQWWKNNDISGDPTGAPAAFKGYATTIDGPAFTSSPGNTPGEPDTIPSYMSIIVTNGVTQSGSTINGSIVHQIIVHTDSGYAADPGHPGTGTIVWDLS